MANGNLFDVHRSNNMTEPPSSSLTSKFQKEKVESVPAMCHLEFCMITVVVFEIASGNSIPFQTH